MSSFGLEGRIFDDDAGILVNSAWSEVVLGLSRTKKSNAVFSLPQTSQSNAFHESAAVVID